MEIPNTAEIQNEVSAMILGTSEITSQAEYTNAADYVKALNTKLEALEERRKEWTRPMLEAKKRIDADFQKFERIIEDEILAVKTAMLIWQRGEQKRLDAEQKKIDEAAAEQLKATGELEVSVPVVNNIKTQRGGNSTATIHKVWTFDIPDMDNVPREYCTPDMAKIRLAISAGVREIKGVRIYQTERITIR